MRIVLRTYSTSVIGLESVQLSSARMKNAPQSPAKPATTKAKAGATPPLFKITSYFAPIPEPASPVAAQASVQQGETVEPSPTSLPQVAPAPLQESPGSSTSAMIASSHVTSPEPMDVDEEEDQSDGLPLVRTVPSVLERNLLLTLESMAWRLSSAALQTLRDPKFAQWH